MDELPYRINDADNHFNEPLDLYERYIDPSKRELAIRYVTDTNGQRLQLFAGRPSRIDSGQVTYSEGELEEMLGQAPASRGEGYGGGEGDPLPHLPGTLLNRLNPLRGLTDEQREVFLAQLREQSEAYGNRELRLALMDDQGIDKALMFPHIAEQVEFEFTDNIDAMYANFRAYNRWIHEEIGYSHQGRMFLPPYLALADPELAVKELDTLLETGARVIMIKPGHAHGGRDNPFGGRSPADPILDPVWSRVNEAGARIAIHLGATDYQKYGADWSEDPEATFGNFNAFQWMMYWGDQPAMDVTAALVLHNFFGRFPNIRVCMAEQGTVWVPYTIRKMDHAFLLGRKTKWGDLTERPSDIFRRHFIVAPFPEENVERVVAEVGIEPIVFGSDFPHGEGLAYPRQYVAAQLKNFSEQDQQRIMRDNLEDYLAGAVA